MDEQLLRTIYALKAGRDKITVSKEDKLMQIQPRDIYYFEAVDNRVFVYMEKEVYDNFFLFPFTAIQYRNFHPITPSFTCPLISCSL